jgi:hypothetical protein
VGRLHDIAFTGDAQAFLLDTDEAAPGEYVRVSLQKLLQPFLGYPVFTHEFVAWRAWRSGVCGISLRNSSVIRSRL